MSDSEAVRARVVDELTPVDVDREFNQIVDDCYSFEAIGGPFADMQPSRVLREMDPTAYRVGVADYADTLDLEYFDGDPYDAGEVAQIREEEEAREGGDDVDPN